MKRSAGLGGIVLVSAGIIAIGIGYFARSTGASETLDPEKTVVVSKSAVVDLVAAFADVPASRLSAGEPVEGAFNRFYLVTGPDLSATVDVHRGSITTLVLTGIVLPNPDSMITSEAALSTARAYLDSHEVARDGMTERIELVDHGESSEYLVTWQRVEAGVIVPDIRQIGIDAASGQVFRFHNLFRPYARPGQPRVTEAEAIKAAREASFLGEDGAVRNVELRVEFDAAGRQYLAWNIYIDGPVAGQPKDQEGVLAHFVVEVDAATGEARVVGQG
jgi:hypothetical protein